MPNSAPIVVNDGTADTTFSPDSVSSTHAAFQDLSQTVVQQRKLLHLDRPANAKANEIRRVVRLNVPYEATLGDGSVVVKTLTMKCELVAPIDTTVTQRQKLRISMADALADSAVAAVLDNPEWFW